MRRKFFPMLFSTSSFFVLFSQALTIYQLNQPLKTFLSIFILCLIAGLISFRLLKLPFYLFATCLIWYSFFPLDQRFSFQWVTNFFKIVQEDMAVYFSHSTAFVPVELALVMVIILLIVMIEWQIEYEKVLVGTVISVGYLLLITTYDGIELSRQILFILCNALFLRLLLIEPKQRKLYFFGGIFLLSLFGASLYLPRKTVENKLLEVSTGIRNQFNQAGLYAYLEQQKSGFQGASTIGFSENNQNLGGPLLDNHQTVFEAQQSTPHYWRVESKAHYTGKGWLNSPDYPASISSYEELPVILSDESYWGELDSEEEILLTFHQRGDYLPIPYGDVTIQNTSETTTFYYSSENHRMNFEEQDNRGKIEIKWQAVRYNLQELSEIPITQPIDEFNYLQLPATVPSDVEDLAKEITKDEETLLGKVQAVETYLKDSGVFRYSKMDATYPENNQDYVAHFLFDSQVGYCDNFSSAMVVLLRTIGIPARWTKGFNSGNLTVREGNSMYVIRNSDAHSWVEVYFEGYGWLPFEPTPTFSQPLNQVVTVLEETSSESSTTKNSTSVMEEINSSQSDEPEEKEKQASFSQQFSLAGKSVKQFFRNHGKKLLMMVLLGLGFLLRQWSLYLWVLILLRRAKEPLLAIYPLLLKKMEKQLYRPMNQPLLQYAQEVEQKFQLMKGDFLTLTQLYEESLYGLNKNSQKEFELLKSVAKKISTLKR